MSDLLKEMMDSVGVEFLSDEYKENIEQESQCIKFYEQKIFPDFDHVTLI